MASKRTADDQIIGQPVSKKPLQDSTVQNIPSSKIGPVIPITSLTPEIKKWTIKVRGHLIKTLPDFCPPLHSTS